MLHERPLLKVSRPVAACSKCRQAKIKCDGALPACGSCEKQGKAAECIGTNDTFARGKERSYVSTLESKIDRLERKLKELRESKTSPDDLPASAISIATTTASSDAGNGTPRDLLDREQRRQRLAQANPVMAKAAKRQEARDIDEIVSDFGYLTINATARDYYGFTAFFSYARLVLFASANRLDLSLSNPPLRPRNELSTDIQHYVSRIHPLLPFIDEATIYYSLNAVFHPSNALATHFDHWVTLMVQAIAHASMSTEAGDEHHLAGRSYASAAVRNHATQILTPGSITGIQAMMFLVQYALFDPRALDLWSLIGATSRLIIDLGLHQDSIRPKTKLETQRRLYYCIYILDRTCSVVHDRAFSFADNTTKVALPPNDGRPATRGDVHEWTRGLDDAVALLGLRMIQSSCYHDMYLSGDEPMADPEMYVWNCYQSLAWNRVEPRAPAAVDSTRTSLKLDQLAAQIRVLNGSRRTPEPSSYARRVQYDRCIEYSCLAHHHLESNLDACPVTFYQASTMFVVAQTFLGLLDHNLEGLVSQSLPPRPDVQGSLLVPLKQGTTAHEVASVRQTTAHLANIVKQMARRYDCAHWNRALEEPLANVNVRLAGYEETN